MAGTDRIKIAIVENSRSTTGAFKAILASVQNLRDDFDFIFIIPKGSATRSVLKQEGVQYFELPFLEISRSWRALLLYIPMLLINSIRLARLVRQSRVDVIHVNDFYNLCGIGAKFLTPGSKLISHVRMLPASFPYSVYRIWRRLSHCYSDYVICVSQAVKRVFPEVPHAIVVYDRIPMTEKYPPFVVRTAADTVELLYLGNYIQGKGQDAALQAFKAAYAEDKRLRLNFYGGDMGLRKNRSFKQALLAEVNEAGLAEVVRFHSFARDIEQIVKAHDIVINFSEVESFSMVCFEALCYGAPLIATDCGGPREMINHEESGLLVPVGDIAAMKSAILTLADDPAKRQKFSTEGRAFVQMKFNTNDEKQRMGYYYRELVNRKSK